MWHDQALLYTLVQCHVQRMKLHMASSKGGAIMVEGDFNQDDGSMHFHNCTARESGPGSRAPGCPWVKSCGTSSQRDLKNKAWVH